MPHSLRTERLLLRPVTLRDAVPFWRALNDPYYTQMTGTWSYPFTPETVLNRIQSRSRADSVMHYWFSVLEGKNFIGSALLFGGEGKGMEIGYSIAQVAAGRGLASESARALCNFGFRTLGLKRITARVSTDNPASQKVMEKLGFQQHPGEKMDWSEHYGTNTPLHHYSLTRERFQP